MHNYEVWYHGMFNGELCGEGWLYWDTYGNTEQAKIATEYLEKYGHCTEIRKVRVI